MLAEQKRNAMPYVPRKVSVKQTTSKVHEQTGIEIPIDRFAWLTDGRVRTIEEGLPLITGSIHDHNRKLNCDEVQREMEQAKLLLLNSFVEEKDKTDEIVPLESDLIGAETKELQKFKQLHNRIMRKKRRMETRVNTGIVRRPPADDMIDNIGRVYIKSAKTRQHVPRGTNPFPAARPREKMSRIPNARETTALVKEKMEKVFRHGCEPFRDIDKEEDFPIDGLTKPESQSSEKSQKTVPEFSEEEEEVHESILVDPSQYDIFWTKARVPFTRDEVEMLEGWRTQRLRKMQEDDLRRGKILAQRKKSIETTFQSRRAFEKEMELTAEDCSKIAKLGPGKGMKKRQSVWQIAAREATVDKSSSLYRKAVWRKLVSQVQRYGYVTCDAQMKMLLEFRRLLLTGCCVDDSVFWQCLSVLDDHEYISRPVMTVIECLRRGIGVPSKDVLAFFAKKDIAPQLYNLALSEMQITTDSARPISARWVEEPES